MKPEEMKARLKEIAPRIEVLSGQTNLDIDEVKELDGLNSEASMLSAKLDGVKKAEELKASELEDQKVETQKQIDAAVKKARDEEAVKARRLPFREAPYQAEYSETWKYDGLDATELSLVIGTLRAAHEPVAPAAIKAMMLRVGELKDDDDQKRKDNGYIRGAFKMATGIDPKMESIQAAVKTEGDPMYTTGSHIGDDWVGAAYSTDLWRVIRANVVIATKIPEQIIPDNYPNVTIPLESVDPTWYKVAQATAGSAPTGYSVPTVPSSKVTTAQKEITVGKMGARVMYTGEMVEDSLIQFVPTLRSQLEISGGEILEHLMIDGDTNPSATGNINVVDGAPGATTVYLICDGFRRLALVDNTANSRSASGTLVISDYVNTLKLMGTAGLGGSDPSKVFFIVDGNVHYANMKLPEVATRDVHSAATIEQGFLRAAYNVPIFPSWQMHRTSAKRMAGVAGTIYTSDASNTTGAIVAVRGDQWRQAYKRRMTMETTRIANADEWEIVALARWGMAYRDSEASAVTFNVGV